MLRPCLITTWIAAVAFCSVCSFGNDTEVVDFDTQVIPVLTKAGCNSGACHGAAAGRGEFRLSLYGSRPSFDFKSIALELQSRRINLVHPEESLVLQKPTGWKDHGGDIRLDEDGDDYETIRNWIEQGAHRTQQRKLKSFSVTPQSIVLKSVESGIELKATAEFSDGLREDVTTVTVFTAEDDSAIAFDASATATVHRKGRHLIVARYLDQVIPIEIIVPLTDPATVPEIAPAVSFIDELIYRRLKVLGLTPSGKTTDNQFARRVYLDLTGRLPTPEQLDAWQSNSSFAKRRDLIDELLASDELVEFWSLRFAELLRIKAAPNSDVAARVYSQWLKNQLAKSAPYDQMVHSLLMAEGDPQKEGPPNFYNSTSDARAQTEFVSELFLGVRLRCANCHDHPLDHWTQDDYHGVSAIFARMDTGRLIRERTTGSVIHPATGEPAVARIPGDRFLNENQRVRLELADWIVSENNPYFARAITNRIWKWLMGRGLVDPVDDLRITNPATHPQLLDRLAKDFVENDFDLRHTIRIICNSQAYARDSSATDDNRTDDRYYSHALVKPLQSEVLLDAICDVTGVAEIPDLRAVSLTYGQTDSDALKVLGRCDRSDNCDEANTVNGGIALKLHLMNGKLLNEKISSSSGRLGQLLKQNVDNRSLIVEFYQRALSRLPTDEELIFWQSEFSATDASTRTHVAEDFLWAILTSREFVTNH